MEELNKQPIDADLNDWVLVVFASKKSHKHYIGQVVSVKKEDDEVEVKFTRKVLSLASTTSSSFIWADPEEYCFVRIQDVIMMLPKPDVSKRGLHRFGISFANYKV